MRTPRTRDSLKILLLTDSFNHCCGRSRHVHLLAKSLKDQGHSVFVAFGSGDGAPMLEADRIPFADWSYLFHQNRSLLNFLHATLAIVQLQQKEQYDVFHAHHRYAAAAARCAAWLFRVPLVMSIHGNVKNKGILPAYTGDHFVAVSESVRSFAVSEDPSIAGEIVTIPNGISLSDELPNSPSKTSFRLQWGIPDNAVIVSMIGRIVEHKGHQLLLEALGQIKIEKPIVLVIVGEGSAEARIRSFAANVGVRTIFSGVVRESSPFFEFSDIIAIPSLGFEGLPITLLEAGKHSKAVIASDIAGMHDVIRDGHNGLTIQPGDIQALAIGLRRLIDDVALRQKLGEALHVLVGREFSVERMAGSFASLYKRVAHRTNYAE